MVTIIIMYRQRTHVKCVKIANKTHLIGWSDMIAAYILDRVPGEQASPLSRSLGSN